MRGGAVSALSLCATMSSIVQDVPQDIKFPEAEKEVLEYWDKNDCFQKSLRMSREENRPIYSFYDGPPFATGMPHYGHILAGTIKDVVTRYAHMNGYRVERKWGWDCHGLPVEYEIDQKLGIKSRDDVLKMSVKAYNAECRSVVMRYADEWKRVVRRMARWIDMENDYKTLDLKYMESVWWVCKQLFEKDLIYRGYKVMPYSTACSTPLSNFEAGQNYKDVSDPECVVAFPVIGADPPISLVAWTTTPWTLPSNLALCVHPTLDYVYIKDKKSEARYIMGKTRISQIFKKEADYVIEKECKGKDLEGLKYEPLFPYFVEDKAEVAYRVLTDTYVTDDGGTGVVHQAPAFGEDDYRVCLKSGVIVKGEAVPCPIDDDGRFTEKVPDFKGLHVKEADKPILAHLKPGGRLVKSGAIKHSYPFCWRSDTPLIYRVIPSWFVKVESIRERLVNNNAKTHWVPQAVKEKRFHNWLENARDWAISRNRFWGTPLPIWRSDDWEEVVCVGSVAELHELSGVLVTDLHKDTIDDIQIPSKQGKGMLKRVEEVFDCWFESGSMPYAQCHYPFENKEAFEASFPGDFIAEGLDQTRGWFYTLVVLGTALFDTAPFKNVIVNGLVLAQDGKKMSKRLKNYPDPEIVVDTHGADALRMYLINSPVVRGEELRFREEGVKDVVRDVLLPWYNSYRFLVQSVRRMEREGEFEGIKQGHIVSDNVMDQWIQAACAGLVQFVRKEMEAYRLYTVMPRLLKYMDDLTNWYIKMNRPRLKGSCGVAECRLSADILFNVLFTLTRCMSPFTPLFCDKIYQNLKLFQPEGERADSIHHLPFPTANLDAMDERMEQKVSRMQSFVEKGRNARDKRGVSLRMPIRGCTAICQDETVLSDLRDLEGYIKEELNVRELITTTEEGDSVTRSAEPDNAVLGKRLGKAMKEVATAVRALNNAQLKEFEVKGSIDVCGHTLSGTDIKMALNFSGASANVQAESYEGVLAIFDMEQDESLRREGLAREIVARVQRMRKAASLSLEDEIEIFYETADQALKEVIAEHAATIRGTLRVDMLAKDKLRPYAATISTIDEDINGSPISLTITRACLHCTPAGDSLSSDVEALRTAVAAVSFDTKTPPKEVTVSVGGGSVTLQIGTHAAFTLAAALNATSS